MVDWCNGLLDIPDEGLPSMPHRLRSQQPRTSRIFLKPAACELLVQALGADGRIDFPTVTEICEGVLGDIEEMRIVARLLSAALQENGKGLSEEGLISLQLKALTVVHELLYDADARQ